MSDNGFLGGSVFSVEGLRSVSVRPAVVVGSMERMAGDYAGYVNEVRSRGKVVTYPRLPPEAATVGWQQFAEPHDEELYVMLNAWPNVDWRREFISRNKLVAAGVGGKLELVQRYPGVSVAALAEIGPEAENALVDYDDIEQGIKQDAEVKRREKVGRGEVKAPGHYELAQFLYDVDVRRKFDIPPAFLTIVVRHAVSDAGKAAAVVQRYLRRKGYSGVTVVQGQYAGGGKAAKRRVMEAAASLPADRSGMLDTVVVGSRIFFPQPGYGLSDSSWSVSGPLGAADVVAAVHKMVCTQGAATVSVLFSVDMVRLGVGIDTRSPLQGAADPHVAQEPIMPSVTYEVSPSKYPKVAHGVIPVEVRGEVRASALRLTGTTAIINKHVVESCGLKRVTVAGGPITVEKECGHDMVMVTHLPLGMAGPALDPRKAEKGEHAVVLYAVPGGRLEASGVCQVTSTETGAVVTTRPAGVRPGCSGGALVAVSDGRLLGMYFGSTISHSTSMSVLSVFPVRLGPGAARSGVPTDANALFADFQARGLAPVLASLAASIEPLVVGGAHRATGLGVGGAVATTVGLDSWPLQFATGVPCVPAVTPADGGSPSDVYLYRGGTCPEFVGEVREPVVGEQVTFVGKDARGDVFFSVLVEVESTTTVRGGCFRVVAPGITPYQLAGTVAVAVSDGAVVGQFRVVEDTYKGARVVVASLSAVVEERAQFVKTLAARVPEFALAAWDVASLSCLREANVSGFYRAATAGREFCSRVVGPTSAGFELRTGSRAEVVGGCVQRAATVADGGWQPVDVQEAFYAFVGIALKHEVLDTVEAFVRSAGGLVVRAVDVVSEDEDTTSTVGSVDFSPTISRQVTSCG